MFSRRTVTSLFAAAVLIAALPGHALMATLAPQQNRQPGEHLSNEVAAPARGNNQATEFRAVLDMDAADLADPELFIIMTMEGSINGTDDWRIVGQRDWQGGTYIGRDGQVHTQGVPEQGWVSSDNRVLTKMRIRWTQNKSARIGASMTFEAVNINASQIRTAIAPGS
jgi:hypothetical protein